MRLVDARKLINLLKRSKVEGEAFDLVMKMINSLPIEEDAQRICQHQISDFIAKTGSDLTIEIKRSALGLGDTTNCTVSITPWSLNGITISATMEDYNTTGMPERIIQELDIKLKGIKQVINKLEKDDKKSNSSSSRQIYS